MNPNHLFQDSISGIPVSVQGKLDNCPHCSRSAHLREMNVVVNTDTKPTWECSVVYQCPSSDCLRLSYVRYQQVPKQGYGVMVEVSPRRKPVLPFAQEGFSFSEMFVYIYKQAAQAELDGLDQICGPGYRKALEFLIKDYCKMKIPDATSAIENEALSQCIRRVDDSRIQGLAHRSVWVGNDETHYVRKWENKDITDLKNLIKLTSTFISHELEAAKYLADMPEGKK